MKDINETNTDNKLYYSFLISIGGYIVEHNSPTDALEYANSISDRINQFQVERKKIQSGENDNLSNDLSNDLSSEIISAYPRFTIKGDDEKSIDSIYARLLKAKRQELDNKLKTINNPALKNAVEQKASAKEDSPWYTVQKLNKLLKILGNSTARELPDILSVKQEYEIMKKISEYISQNGADVGGLRSIITKSGIKLNGTNDQPELGVINAVLQKIQKRSDNENFNEDEKFAIFEQFKLSVINMSHKKSLDQPLKQNLKADYLQVQLDQLNIDALDDKIGKRELKKFEDLKELLATVIIGKNPIEAEIKALKLIKEELQLDDPIKNDVLNRTFGEAYGENETDKAIDKYKEDLDKHISKLENDKSKKDMKDMNDIKIRAGKLVLGLLAISVTSLLVAFLAPKLIAAASIALIVTGAISGGAAISTGVYSYMRYNEISTKQSDNLGPDREMIVENSSRPSRSTTLDVEGLSGTVVRQSDTRNPLSGSEYNKASSSDGEQPRVDQGPGGGRI